jgi:hypothetical protein
LTLCSVDGEIVLFLPRQRFKRGSFLFPRAIS